MILSSKRLILVLAICLFVQPISLGAECQIELRENVEQRALELVLGDVEVKIAPNENLMKSRVNGLFGTFEWSFVKLNPGPSRITTFFKRKGVKIFLSQAVGIKTQKGINWAVFKCDNCASGSISGKAYFVIDDKAYCHETNKVQWEEAVHAAFGDEFAEDVPIEGNDPGDGYSQFGF